MKDVHQENQEQLPKAFMVDLEGLFSGEPLDVQRDLAFQLVLEAYAEGQRYPKRVFRDSHVSWKLRRLMNQ